MNRLERQSNFEFMRIVSMFFIVLWHVMVHGKIFSGLGDLSHFVESVLLGLVVVHVNSLIFVTGYFNSNKKEIPIKKLVKLVGVAWFYKAVIAFVFYTFHLGEFGKITLMEELLPLDLNNYWFINAYLFLYVFSPYLNKVTENMDEKSFFRFLLMMIFSLSVLPFISSHRVISNNGSNIIQFILIYYLGSYFRKYPLKDNYHFKNTRREHIQILLVLLFFFFAFVNISFHALGEKMCSIHHPLMEYFGRMILTNYVLYSNLFVIIQSCAYCLLFETFSIRSKVINWIAGSTLGIYLIHDNHIMRGKLYEVLLPKSESFGVTTLLTLVKVSVIIFVLCFLVESIRRLVSKFLTLVYNRWIRKEKTVMGE